MLFLKCSRKTKNLSWIASSFTLPHLIIVVGVAFEIGGEVSKKGSHARMMRSLI